MGKYSKKCCVFLVIYVNPFTRAEQADLKKLVHEVVAHNAGATTDAVWNAVKKPLHIRRYQDMDQWQYWRSKSMLQKQLQKK